MIKHATNYAVCKHIQAIKQVTNHNKAYNGHI